MGSFYLALGYFVSGDREPSMGDPSARKARVTGGLVLRVVRPWWGLGPHRSRAALWKLDRDLVSTEEPAAGGLPNLRDGNLGFWGLEPTAVAARAGGVRGRSMPRAKY